MSVRAKFVVWKTSKTKGQKQVKNANGKTDWVPAMVESIEANPVSGNNDPEHENTKFWQASPSGSFVLGCVNEGVLGDIQPGDELLIEITVIPQKKA